MNAFVKKRFPDESKTWRFMTNSPVTPENLISFNSSSTVRKVPTVAEVSWRSDLQLLSAQYAVATILHGIAREGHEIQTPDFDVIGFETFYEGNVVSHRNLVLCRTVFRGADVEVVPVPFHDENGLIAAQVLGNADVFMHEKIARIEDASKIARLGLIG